MASLLQVRNLTKSFASLKALDGVTLDVQEGKVNILIGPNGSGKTTLINTVSGYYAPDSGTVIFGDRDITGMPPFKLYDLGISRTFQIPSLFWNLTVLENVLLAEKGHPGEMFRKSLFRGSWIDKETYATEKAFKILDLLGLQRSWDKKAITLSGGQMKLLEMGRALMSDAKLLLLDEPVSGVNPTLAHGIFANIIKLRDELKITFFIIEHRLDIALQYVDNMTAMAFGKVIATGEPSQVITDSQVVEAYLGA